jgi:hypothetical protein
MAVGAQPLDILNDVVFAVAIDMVHVHLAVMNGQETA